MTTVLYFDESFQQITDEPAAYAADYRVLSGYGGTNSPKTLSSARIKRWQEQGPDTGIAALFEATSGRALTAGKSGGAADARASRAYWRSVGMPDDAMITPAVDVNVSMSDLPALREYFTGWKSADTCLPWAYIEPDIGEQLYADGLIGGIFAPAAYSWDPAGAGSFTRPHVGWTQERNGINRFGGNIDSGHISVSAPIWWSDSMADITDPSWPYLIQRVDALTHGYGTIQAGPEAGKPVETVVELNAIKAQAAANGGALTALTKAVAAIPTSLVQAAPVDIAALAAALAPTIESAVNAAVAPLSAQVADLVTRLEKAVAAEAAALNSGQS
jgi:hypothetical protein